MTRTLSKKSTISSWNLIVFTLSSILLDSIPPGSAQLKLERKFDKGHKSVTVSEGDTLSIFCNVSGVDNVSEADINVVWKKDGVALNLTELENSSQITGTGGGAEVVVHTPLWFDYLGAQSTERGWYSCYGEHNGTNSTFQFYVRVKDNLLPLWPFMGICGQVLFLGALLFVYEMRRNKNELEEVESENENGDD